ncbi:unnamed protein product [Schistosoma spindalis]|nr:unnamed protein product [Schistosoma spindale]
MNIFFAPRDLKYHLKQQLPVNNDLTNEQLLLLHNIFGDLIMKALWIIEYGSIIIERSKSSQHQLFRVESNSGTISYCSNYTRYCRCFNIVQKYIHHCYELWILPKSIKLWEVVTSGVQPCLLWDSNLLKAIVDMSLNFMD